MGDITTILTNGLLLGLIGSSISMLLGYLIKSVLGTFNSITK